MASLYSILSFTTPKGLPVPVGVAMWCPSLEFGAFKVIDADEPIIHLPLGPDRALLRFAADRLGMWCEDMPETGSVFDPPPLKRSQTEFWAFARACFNQRFRLGEFLPIDNEPTSEEVGTKQLNALFEAILAPYRPTKGEPVP